MDFWFIGLVPLWLPFSSSFVVKALPPLRARQHTTATRPRYSQYQWYRRSGILYLFASPKLLNVRVLGHVPFKKPCQHVNVPYLKYHEVCFRYHFFGRVRPKLIRNVWSVHTLHSYYHAIPRSKHSLIDRFPNLTWKRFACTGLLLALSSLSSILLSGWFPGSYITIWWVLLDWWINISRFPFYFEIKTLFLLFLALPQIQVSHALDYLMCGLNSFCRAQHSSIKTTSSHSSPRTRLNWMQA